MEQKSPGTFRVWMEPFVPLRVPLIFNLRRDPYERATITSNTYHDWQLDRAFLLVPAQAYVGKFLETFEEFPPRQEGGKLQPRPSDGEVERTRRCSIIGLRAI